ncbi:MAG: hypothetical protein KatS3mg022_1671 [Armatimonadota bacterium]|nr:MAG: hypothetical protein KatS3mg022_1671 [Armatimonadota bacterium]
MIWSVKPLFDVPVSSGLLAYTSLVPVPNGNTDTAILTSLSRVSPTLFFKFYAEVMRQVNLPVDVIDLSEPTPLAQVVKERGVVIYE